MDKQTNFNFNIFNFQILFLLGYEVKSINNGKAYLNRNSLPVDKNNTVLNIYTNEPKEAEKFFNIQLKEKIKLRHDELNFTLSPKDPLEILYNAIEKKDVDIYKIKQLTENFIDSITEEYHHSYNYNNYQTYRKNLTNGKNSIALKYDINCNTPYDNCRNLINSLKLCGEGKV